MKHLLLILIALFFIACSPRYEIRTHYTPPTDVEGKTCVQSCSNEKNSCQSRCDQQQDQCLATAQQSVQDSFPRIMEEYRIVQSQYLYDMDNYNRDMNAWGNQKARLQQDVNHYRPKCNKDNAKSYECRRSNDAQNELRHMYQSEPEEPNQPVQPTLAEEIARAQESCHNECGCEKAYDTCFSSCGGTVVYEKFCVENCD